MSHDIEIHTDATTGETLAAVAVAREPAWHRLGHFKSTGGLAAEDVLVKAYLGEWHVELVPLTSPYGPVNGQFAVARTNPFTHEREHIGGAEARTNPVVGNVYHPIQMESIIDMLNALRGQTGGEFETAGSLGGGRRVFITCKLPEGMLIGGVDPVDRYITVLNDHCGIASLLVLDTPVRSVCANTVAAALRNFRSKVSIWHTESADMSIAELRAALGVTFAYDEALQTELERMIQAPCSEAQFVKGARKIWPEPKSVEANPSKRKVSTHSRRELELVQLFTGSETNEAIRGTKWAAYNAVTEYLDWTAPVPANQDGSLVRAQRTVAPGAAVEQTKELAFATFRVPA